MIHNIHGVAFYPWNSIEPNFRTKISASEQAHSSQVTKLPLQQQMKNS